MNLENICEEREDWEATQPFLHGSPQSATVTVPVKLSREQLDAILTTGEPTSQYVREAVQMRLEEDGISQG